MEVTIYPSGLSGTVKAIASKSAAHRLLIAAAFADRPTRLWCSEVSKDIGATAGCLRSLGCGISYNAEDGFFDILPVSVPVSGALMDCGESGSTLRFLLPVVCALGTGCRIIMHGRLSERPLSPLWEELEEHGARLRRNPDSSISVSGRLRAGSYTLAADISSQFISGMLFAMPLIEGRTRLLLKGRVESRNYILMTIQALGSFGIDAGWNDDCLVIPDGAGYISPGELVVEGDWSNAAFWLCSSFMNGGSITVTGLDGDSVQGDRAIRRLIPLIQDPDAVIDASDIPDLVPVLSVLAAVSPGQTRFINAGRLRIKESDRIRTTVEMLAALGASAHETEDGIVVSGRKVLEGGTVSSHNDHRIAMSAAIAASACRFPVRITGAEAVDKSYPGFWKDFEALGGHILTEH